MSTGLPELRLSRRQLRKMGVNKLNVKTVLFALDDRGELSALTFSVEGKPQGMSPSLITILIMAELQEQNKDAYCQAEGIFDDVDWEEFFAFLEKLITMLLPLLIKRRERRTR